MSYELLKADTEHADACMLLDYFRECNAMNKHEPLTLRAVCEVVHRKQGETLNTHDAAHMRDVIARINHAAQLANIQFIIILNQVPPMPDDEIECVRVYLHTLPHLPVRCWLR